jgi:hypothetical protein
VPCLRDGHEIECAVLVARLPVLEVALVDAPAWVRREVPSGHLCHRGVRLDRDTVKPTLRQHDRRLARARRGVECMRRPADERHQVVDQLGRIRRANAVVELGVFAEYETPRSHRTSRRVRR